MVDQTGEFARGESARYVRDRQGFAPSTIFAEDLAGLGGTVSTVLDVGCGHGVNLRWTLDHLSAAHGVGVEPSADAVAVLQEQYAADARLSFVTAPAHALPFATDAFDLVVVWSVLHWIGRDEYLQSIGEAIRVARKWLLVMDFAPAQDYRTPYRHVEGLHTYKQDFVTAVLSSGAMRLTRDERWWEPVPGEPRTVVHEHELTPFHGNPLNWNARRVCLFEKDRELLPLFDSTSFGC